MGAQERLTNAYEFVMGVGFPYELEDNIEAILELGHSANDRGPIGVVGDNFSQIFTAVTGEDPESKSNLDIRSELNSYGVIPVIDIRPN